MKLVIEIDEKTFNEIMYDAEYTPMNLTHYERIIARGTPLPKGHERLIDVNVLKTAFPCDESVKTEWVRAMIAYTPTIIEADNAENEE